MSAELDQGPTADEYTEMVSKFIVRDLKEMLELEEEYEQTHDWRDSEKSPTHFSDDFTGREIPFKYHKSGKYGGETCLNTKLYKAGVENGGRYYELRTKFQNALYVVQNSNYESIEEAVSEFKD